MCCNQIFNIIAAILSRENFHVSTVKGYLLPKTVDSKTLVIAISISGNTKETLSILDYIPNSNYWHYTLQLNIYSKEYYEKYQTSPSFDAIDQLTRIEISSEMARKNIFDMLKDYFEGEEEPAEEPEGEEEMGEDMMDEVKGDEDKMEEADLEEASSTGFGDAGAKNTSGKDVGYTPAKTTKGDGKLHESKTNLQERFQKLANIIK